MAASSMNMLLKIPRRGAPPFLDRNGTDPENENRLLLALAFRGSGRDRDVAPEAALVVEVHDAVHLREERVVLGAADVQARLERRAALPDEDRAPGDELAGEALDAEALRVAVASVAGRARTFFVCHLSVSARP